MKLMSLSYQTHGEILDCCKPDHLSSSFESRVAYLAISNRVLSDLLFIRPCNFTSRGLFYRNTPTYAHRYIFIAALCIIIENRK